MPLKKRRQKLKNLNAVWEEWKEFGAENSCMEKFREKLLKIVFENPGFFGIPRDDDDFQEFMLYLGDKLNGAISNYVEEIADFSTYFSGAVRTAHFWWRKKRVRYDQIHASYEALVVQEEFGDSFGDKIFEETSSVSDLEIFVSRGLLGGKKSDETCTEMSVMQKRREEQLKKMCMVLAVKSCRFLHEPLTEKICRFTGTNREEMEKIISKARVAVEKKEKRLSGIISRRNYTYFRRKRLNIIRQNAVPDAENDLDGLTEKIRMLDERWKRSSMQAEKLEASMVPSNIAVGKLLSISPKKVARLMTLAQKISEEIAEMRKNSDEFDL